MGAGLSKLLGWKVDLKNPLLEVNLGFFKRLFTFIYLLLVI